MRSKTSFFNKTIFWKNITHFWPIWALYGVLCIWSMPVCSYFNIRTYNNAGYTEAELAYLKVWRALEGMELSMNPWILFGVAIISAVAVFSYLYNSRSVNMIHAMPVCRVELFVTNYLSGFLFMVVPQLVSFLLTVFVWFGNGITHLEYLLQWLGIVTEETFFAYSFGIFCVMLTGNIVAAPAYFVILNYLYQGIWDVWNMVRHALIYGFSGNTEMVYGAGMVPIEYLRKNVKVRYPEKILTQLPKIEGMACLKWYILTALVFVVLAILMYRKRQLECAGDMIAISWVKPLARWLGAVMCAGLTGELIQTTFFEEKVLLGEAFPVLLVCWILGGILSFFGIEMIIEKRFMVFRKGLLIQSGMFLVLVVLFLGSMGMDIFHLKEKLPSVEEVSEVYVQGSYERYLTEASQIQDNIALQKKIIESREEYQQYFKKYYGKEECNDMMLDIIYVMKNGKKQVWSYSLPLDEYYLEEEDSAVRELLEQESNPEDYLAYYFTEQYSNISLQSGSSIDWVDENYNFQSVDISTEDAEKLIEAFKEDVASGNYRIYPYSAKERMENTYVNTLTICFTPPKGAHMLQYGVEYGDTISDGKSTEYTGIILTKECKNTIALLEKMGYIDEKHRLVTEEEFDAAFEAIEEY